MSEQRTVTFVCPGRPGQAMVSEFRIVTRPAGSAGVSVTTEQAAALGVIEKHNSGRVPLTASEFDAMSQGEEAYLVELAGFPGSNLRPLFCWDDQESVPLFRQRLLHGGRD